MASKIIVIGSTAGHLPEALTKLTALHSKNNFAFAIILGDISSSTEAESLLSGDLKLPLPTYFTIGATPLSPAVVSRIESNAGEVVENLFFLGKKGSIVTSEGIRIVAAGGVFSKDGDKSSFLATHAPFEFSALKKHDPADILISTDWPVGIHDGQRSGSPAVTELVVAVRPRYHFVAGGTEHLARTPYRNELRKGENETRFTLFYSLGDWGNAQKAKAMVAFSLDPSAPPASPGYSTPSPYLREEREAKRGAKRSAEEGTFFWGDHTSSGQQKRTHKRRHPERPPPPGPENCFFCLSNPALEKHLIVSIGNEAYLTTAKGPLTSSATNTDSMPFSAHILIIPFSHTPMLQTIEDPESRKATVAEMKRYLSTLEKFFAAHGATAVAFEVRRVNGIHAHWQVIPVKKELVERIDAAFDDAAKDIAHSFEDEHTTTTTTHDDDGEEDAADRGNAFTYWIGGQEKGRTMHLAQGEYFNLQFGRQVLAEVIGTEQKRINWKECVMSLPEEIADAKAFKEAFKEYDFSLEE
ncbi:CwfJ C-terminus 1-domain-containing protein-like protein [Tricharina praecox]|uniref:CwfJ C-terminus 1-domain-containing protein-like protein n=1 Tax=Tricharina praecox TaxID=43433 RepID=UPI0022203492|nr:CwfJ C-terminus 1-domain-containing protein-like protein [Tricharina praecox]KAI5853571.1 CwfJ C-terminus 1-domain-containing protein-like protein [Tricharina praecox]